MGWYSLWGWEGGDLIFLIFWIKNVAELNPFWMYAQCAYFALLRKGPHSGKRFPRSSTPIVDYSHESPLPIHFVWYASRIPSFFYITKKSHIFLTRMCDYYCGLWLLFSWLRHGTMRFAISSRIRNIQNWRKREREERLLTYSLRRSARIGSIYIIWTFRTLIAYE